MSALVNGPLFSNNAVDEYLEKPVKLARRSLKNILTGAKKDENQKKECQVCQKNHDLDAYFQHQRLQVDESKRFPLKSKLCFGCNDIIRKEHCERNCPKRRKCSICKEKHLTRLHGLQPKKKSPEKEDDNYTPPMPPENEEKKDSVKACASTVAHRDVISMCVVQVKVKYKDSNSVYNTYAMLDNCSQRCFVKSSLIKNLRIKGRKTSVGVKTLTGEKTHTSFSVDGLKISRTLELDAEWISISKAYTKNDLPVGSTKISTPEKIKKWRYLLEIAGEINHGDDAKMELLIGANCTRALEPVQVIASRDGGPYAMKTVLGWCIVRPIACINPRNRSLTCTRVAVREAGSNEIADHYFAVEEQINPNERIPAMLKRIYEGEFIEQQVKFRSIIGKTLGKISDDERQFLKLMEQETIKVNGHYVVSLPLKSKDASLPNKRSLALKRLNCLQTRFLKDEHFYEMYKTFIADMIAKRYARKADNKWQIRKNMVHITPWGCSSSKTRESPCSI